MAVFAVEQADFAAVGAGDLLGQRQAHATAGGLGGVEGDKQVFRIGDAHAAIFDGDQKDGIGDAPVSYTHLNHPTQRSSTS